MTRNSTLLIPALFLSACGGGEVLVKGTVFDGPGDTASHLGGAKVQIRDGDGAAYASTTAKATGRFEVLAPVGETIYAEISGEGFETTSFTGVSGLDDVLKVADGLLYGFSSAERVEWEALFAGCPEVGEGGVVFGELRILEITDPTSGEHPLVGGVAEVTSFNGKKEWNACYLDAEGKAFDPDAVHAGGTGRFAIFGIAPGEHILSVGWEFAPAVWSMSEYNIRVSDDGVAPLFPAWVEWPELQ